jgi:hypothetical protein
MLSQSKLGKKSKSEAKVLFCRETHPKQFKVIEKIQFSHGSFMLAPEEFIGLPITKNPTELYRILQKGA